MLDVFGQRCGDAVRVNGVIVETLGLEKDLVPVLVGEANDLVLDRGAVSRAAALDLAGIDRRTAQVRPDQSVRLGPGVGDMAVNLGRRNRVRHVGEGDRRIVARLPVKTRPVNRPSIEPRRRSGFQPAQRKTCAFKSARQAEGGRFAITARGTLLGADMDDTPQEGPGRQDDTSGRDFAAVSQHNSRHGARTIKHKVLHGPLENIEILLLRQQGLHGLAVEFPVGLGPWAPNGGALRAIEHPELDPAAVDGAAHDAVERIDFAHKVSLAEPADGRVARHLANGFHPVRDEHGARTDTCRRRRGLAAGVAATDHDNVVAFVHGRGAVGAHFAGYVGGRACRVKVSPGPMVCMT